MAVLDRGVEDRAEHDVGFVDGVGRQWPALVLLVLAPVLFEVAVVAGDPGGGELVERVVPELGAEVVADDLLVPGDGGVRELESFHPGVGVDAEGGHLPSELLLLVALLEGVLQRGVRIGGGREPAPAELLVPEVGLLGVDGHPDLIPPSLPRSGLVRLDRPAPTTPGARATRLRLLRHVRATVRVL